MNSSFCAIAQWVEWKTAHLIMNNTYRHHPRRVSCSSAPLVRFLVLWRGYNCYTIYALTKFDFWYSLGMYASTNTYSSTRNILWRQHQQCPKSEIGKLKGAVVSGHLSEARAAQRGTMNEGEIAKVNLDGTMYRTCQPDPNYTAMNQAHYCWWNSFRTCNLFLTSSAGNATTSGCIPLIKPRIRRSAMRPVWKPLVSAPMIGYYVIWFYKK